MSGLQRLTDGISRVFSGSSVNKTEDGKPASASSSTASTSAKSSCMESIKKNYLSAPLHSGDTTFKQEAQNVGLRVFSALIPVHLLGGSVTSAFKGALSTPAQLERRKTFLENQIEKNNQEIKDLQSKLPDLAAKAKQEHISIVGGNETGRPIGPIVHEQTKLAENIRHVDIIKEVNTKLQNQLNSIEKRLGVKEEAVAPSTTPSSAEAVKPVQAEEAKPEKPLTEKQKNSSNETFFCF